MKLKVFSMMLTVNGQNYKVFIFKPIAISNLIQFFRYQRQMSLIEYNGRIQSDLNQASLHIKENARLEVITIVGGG